MFSREFFEEDGRETTGGKAKHCKEGIGRGNEDDCDENLVW